MTLTACHWGLQEEGGAPLDVWEAEQTHLSLLLVQRIRGPHEDSLVEPVMPVIWGRCLGASVEQALAASGSGCHRGHGMKLSASLQGRDSWLCLQPAA